ncbi:unnamed protein product, partial [Umbelopsis ramanniana]
MAVDIPPLDVRLDIDQPHQQDVVECLSARGAIKGMDISPPSLTSSLRVPLASPPPSSFTSRTKLLNRLRKIFPPSNRFGRGRTPPIAHSAPMAFDFVPLPISFGASFVGSSSSTSVCSLPSSLAPSVALPSFGLCPSSVPLVAAPVGPCPSSVPSVAASVGLCPSSGLVALSGVVPFPMAPNSFFVSLPSLPGTLDVSAVLPAAPVSVPAPAPFSSSSLSTLDVSAVLSSVPGPCSSSPSTLPSSVGLADFPAASSLPCPSVCSDAAVGPMANVPALPGPTPWRCKGKAIDLGPVASSLPCPSVLPDSEIGPSPWKGKGKAIDLGPVANSASSSLGCSPMGSPRSEGVLPEFPSLRKIATPTGRYAFHSREFEMSQASSSRSRFRSPSPPASPRSWKRSCPSSSDFCRFSHRRVAKVMRPADSGSLPATPTIPFPASSAPSSHSSVAASRVATNTMTAWQHRTPASPLSRENTPPMALRDGTISPMEYGANLSPLHGPLLVLADDDEDVVDDVQRLDDFQVLDEADSQPGSPMAEREGKTSVRHSPSLRNMFPQTAPSVTVRRLMPVGSMILPAKRER